MPYSETRSPGQKSIHQISAVKPLCEQPLFRCVFENCFEQSEIATAESAQVSGLHFGDDCSHFSRRDLRDGLDVGSILVPEGRVGEQILHGDQTFGLEHLGARRSNAFDVLERSGSV